LKDLNKRLNGIREVMANIQKEINESGASVANLRDNIRARRLVKQINEVQTEIDSHDMEEMAKARRNFDEKYKLAKEKEDNLRVEVWINSPDGLPIFYPFPLHPMSLQYGRVRGELDTLEQQVDKYHSDLKRNFKDINKRYTDQLVKVKVANPI